MALGRLLHGLRTQLEGFHLRWRLPWGGTESVAYWSVCQDTCIKIKILCLLPSLQERRLQPAQGHERQALALVRAVPEQAMGALARAWPAVRALVLVVIFAYLLRGKLQRCLQLLPVLALHKSEFKIALGTQVKNSESSKCGLEPNPHFSKASAPGKRYTRSGWAPWMRPV